MPVSSIYLTRALTSYAPRCDSDKSHCMKAMSGHLDPSRRMAEVWPVPSDLSPSMNQIRCPFTDFICGTRAKYFDGAREVQRSSHSEICVSESITRMPCK